MLPTTISAVNSILKTDASVSTSERKVFVKKLSHDHEPAPTVQGSRIMRRAEVARRLGVGTRAIDNWAKDGVLRKVQFPGRVRSVGFSSEDVDALISGDNVSDATPIEKEVSSNE